MRYKHSALGAHGNVRYSFANGPKRALLVNQTQGPSSEQPQLDDDEEETSSSASSTPRVNDEAEQPPTTSTHHPLPGVMAFSRPAMTQASPLVHQPTQHLDTEVTRLECHLDNWCLDLKRNVLVSLLSNCRLQADNVSVNAGGIRAVEALNSRATSCRASA